MSDRSWLLVACGAALAASCGDLMLLYVGNAQRPELALPAAPAALLGIGAALGIVGLPMYGTGYWAIARQFTRRGAVGAEWIARFGIAGACVGAVIHGLTAVEIASAIATDAAAKPPLEAVAGGDRTLLYLWLVCGALLLAASVVYGVHRARATAGAARWSALVNPAVLTLLLVAVAMPSELLRSFLAPAAPNLAHVLFFLTLARIEDVE